MKKRFFSFFALMILFVFIFANSAYALEEVDVERLTIDHPDYQEVASLKDSLIQRFRNIGDLEGISQMPEDYPIDFTTAMKIYLDTDIFQTQNASKDEIVNRLNAGYYIWLLNVYYEGKTFQVDIVPKSNGTGWETSGIETNDVECDYAKAVNDKLKAISYQKPVCEVKLVGGLPHIHNPVAVLFSESTADALIPLFPMTISGTDNQKASLAVQNASFQDEVYQYTSIMEAVNHMPKENGDYSGGSGIVLPDTNEDTPSYLPILAAVGISFFLLVGFLVLICHKFLGKKRA